MCLNCLLTKLINASCLLKSIQLRRCLWFIGDGNYKLYMMFDAVPTRLVLGVVICLTCWVSYMYRVNMSLNLVAMVPSQANATSMKSECAALATNQTSRYNDEYTITRRTPADSVTFDWSAQQQGYILSGFFWGYFVTGVIGGPLAEFTGPRNMLFGSMLLCAVLTILTPQIAKIHYLALTATRIVQGLASGPHFSALQMLVAHWAPPEERGLFVSGLLAGSLGTVATWTLTGPVIAHYGWEYAFYAPGLIALAWSFMLWFLVYDSPLVHPRISESEREYILSKTKDKLQQEGGPKLIPPLKSMLTSGPFWALVILHYGNTWGFYFAMTAAPKYVSTALGFSISSTGILASLPYLARWSFCVMFGAIGDVIMKKKLMSTTAIRKFFCIFSHIIPSALTFSLGYLGCSPILSIFIITSTLASNGAITLTNLVNNHDLAPNYAGTTYGIINGIGSTAGFITPLITAYFTKNGNGFAEWRPVFILGASVYFAAAAYFIVFGTGELQEWNEIVVKDKQKDEMKRNIKLTELKKHKLQV